MAGEIDELWNEIVKAFRIEEMVIWLRDKLNSFRRKPTEPTD